MLKVSIERDGISRTIILSSRHCFSKPELELAEKNTTCPICLDESDEEINFMVLACNHIYHSECIIKWLSSDERNGCPLCRQEHVGDFREREDCFWLDEALFSVTKKRPDAEVTCFICRNMYEDDLWFELECGHFWHHKCFQRWINCRNVCPLDNLTPRYKLLSS